MLNTAPIPCYIDKKNYKVYHLSGSSFLTGPEFLLAKKQVATFFIKSAFYIHPKEKLNKNTNETETIKPFHNILKSIQEKRRVFFLKDTSIKCYTSKRGMGYM